MNVRTRLILIGLSIVAALFFLWPTYRYFTLDRTLSQQRTEQDSTAWLKAHPEYMDAKKANRLKLGLDLQGGIYITMEVDIPALLYESAQRDAVDDIFEKVIQATRDEAIRSEEPVIDIFLRHFDEIARPAGRTLLYYYDLGAMQEVTDQAIIRKLRSNVTDAVDQAEEVIRQRIDKYGVSEVSIQKVGGRRIVLELPGVTNEKEVRSLLQTTARLEFKLVKNDAEAAKLFRRIDDLLAQRPDSLNAATGDTTTPNTATTGADTSGSTVASTDTTGGADTSGGVASTDTAGKDTSNPYAGLSQDEQQKKYLANHPFTKYIYTTWKQSADASRPQQIDYEKSFPEGNYYFSATKASIDSIKAILAMPEIKALIPDDRIVAFTAQPEYTPKDGPPIYGVYVLTRDPELTGDVVTDAAPDFDPQTGERMVRMFMNAEGADQWANITGENLKKRVAIVLDSLVYSAPVVQSRIAGGVSSITGMNGPDEANLLAVVLKAGALKAPIKIIEERIIGPSLGADSIRQGVQALIGAAILVVLFMMFYYSFGGVIADLAVLLNLFLVLAVLSGFNATLTLPGIAGLVLTIGMAVDGNILIFERIREELAAGKALKRAVELGYEKAFAAIIDSNVTTFITGAILYIFGSGPIRGFAITLMIGIVMTVFTSVYVTHTVYLIQLQRGTGSMNFGQPKRRREEEPATV